MSGSKKLAVLILSCDKYADLWQPFLGQFRRYFPVEDHRVYLGSNTIPCADAAVIPILSGEDRDWSSSLKAILSQISEEKVFVILEDLFLASPVDASAFRSAVRFLLEGGAMHVKYWASPLPDAATDDPNIGVYLPGAPYRATVCGFWDRLYLHSLLIEGENPWNFEILGSYRASYASGIYGLKRPLCDYRNMVEKGCWIPRSLEWARQQGIGVDEAKRPLLQGANACISRLKMMYFDAMLAVPWRFRVALMNKLRRVLISY